MTDTSHPGHAALDDSEAHVHRCLARLPFADVDVELTAAACALRGRAAGEALAALADAGLLERHGRHPVRGPVYGLRGAVGTHPRTHVDQLGRLDRLDHEEPDPVAGEPLRRALDWLLAAATAAAHLLDRGYRDLDRDHHHPPADAPAFTTASEALAWLDAQHTILMAAVRAAHAAGLHGSTWRLVHAMRPCWTAFHHYPGWLEAHELAYDAAQRCGHASAQREILRTWGVALRNAGRHAQATVAFTRVIAAARTAGDELGVARALYELGGTHLDANHPRQSEPFLRRARGLLRTLGDVRGVALCDVCLGRVALVRDRPTEAITLLSEARAALVAERHAFDAARALAWLGRAQAHDGDYATALYDLRLAHDEFVAVGSSRWIARVREMLGDIAREQHRLADAARFHAQALEMYGRSSPRDAKRLRRHLDGLKAPTDSPDDDRDRV
ncbi:tetratricopeptide repeat protein [Streptomyces sp. WMMC500]|uniref:tetratricopeptide repeat protein n=1 Tax=Streptomyces sp. WMMC500 TaxID=3015154 RepID=UPI00248BE10B|nr:tetratricopeptide repeat protein [Streptomyces sp. WMMC500]WBB58495.1 tetratricopeptide repeat protein [Streptomyces sp. WMMC500]